MGIITIKLNFIKKNLLETHLHVVGILECGDGSGLDQELIDTNQAANVTARNVLDGLDVTTHHQNGTLDGLLVQIFLLSGRVVRAHDAALLTGLASAREDATEGVETSLVGGGHHLGDIHHEGDRRRCRS